MRAITTTTTAALALLLSVMPSWAATFQGRVISVADGDTVTVVTNLPCEEQAQCVAGKAKYRLRLSSIDAPESNQPYGQKAKKALYELVYGRQVDIDATDKDRYGRLIAKVYVDGLWVNAEMVRRGHGWVYRQYATEPQLYKLESEARAKMLGLWGLPEDEQTPPWEWRRRHH